MNSVSREPTPSEPDGAAGLLAPGETVGAASAGLKPLRRRAPEGIAVADLDDGRTLAVEAGSEVAIWAFNSPQDRDPDLVLAPPGAHAGQVEHVPVSCWLVVRRSASIRGGAEEARPAAAGCGRATVECADYRRHDRSDAAAQAVAAGLRHPRFAHRLADVQALRAGEALTYEAHTSLTLALDLPWCDVLAGGLGSLAGILGGATPLAAALPAAGSVRGTIRFAGSFSFVFAGLANKRTRFALRRGAVRTGEEDEPGVAVELADPQQLEAALHDVMPGLLGCGQAVVGALLEKRSPGELSQDESEAADALCARLDLGGGAENFAALQRKLRQVAGAIAEALAELAAGKLAAGFAYEHARLARGAVLLQAVLDQGALERLHASLCRGDLVPLVLAAAAGADGVTLESFLNRRSCERTRCWGFTLGVAPWAAGGRQRRTLTRVVHEDPAGRRQVSCLGLGAYEARWLADVADWTADLKAEMPRFARADDVLVAEFDIGLHLAWHWRYLRFEADELDTTVDMGLLWGVLDPQHAVAVGRHLAAALGRPAEVTVQLRIDDAPLRAVLPAVAGGRDADFGAALGAAMPWRRGSPGRAEPARRRELYGPLWVQALAEPDAPARALVALARKALADSGDPQLGFLEENYLRLTPTSTFVGLARVANQSTAAAWAGFRSAAALLHEARTTSTREDGSFERAFALMANLWALPHHVRALGAFLLEAAAQAGVAGAVARTITIVAGDSGSETALVVAAPTT